MPVLKKNSLYRLSHLFCCFVISVIVFAHSLSVRNQITIIEHRVHRAGYNYESPKSISYFKRFVREEKEKNRKNGFRSLHSVITLHFKTFMYIFACFYSKKEIVTYNIINLFYISFVQAHSEIAEIVRFELLRSKAFYWRSFHFYADQVSYICMYTKRKVCAN